MEQYKN